MLIFPPSAPLRDLVKRFLLIESAAGEAQTVLPDTSLVAVIRFKGDCTLDGTRAPWAAVSGLRDTARTIAYSRGGAAILALFTPVGAAAFLRAPLDQLFNATTPMDALVGTQAQLSLLRERIAGAAHHRERVRILEAFLLSVAGDFEPDPLVSASVARIEATKGGLRIADLVRHIGLSQSALERRFRRAVGTTPKKFASIVRLRHLTRLFGAGANFTSLAHSAGYYDQAHFIKDMKRFTGVAPRIFFQRLDAFC
jgi:AraC-like DNA-binding protein